jgi:hypothetical protein
MEDHSKIRAHLNDGQRLYFEATGFFVSMWACGNLRRYHDGRGVPEMGRRMPEAEPPRSFDRKIRFLLKYVRSHDLGFTSEDALRKCESMLR